jgi:hypothetical protein
LVDALQWEQHRDLLRSDDNITVTTTGDDLVSGGGGWRADEVEQWWHAGLSELLLR